MEFQRLKEQWISPEENVFVVYYTEVARRFEKELGEWLSLDECVALSDIVRFSTFIYDDGFIVNRDVIDEPWKLIGVVGSILIALCFCIDIDVEYEHLYYEYMKNSGTKKYDRLYDVLLSKILSNPTVQRE